MSDGCLHLLLRWLQLKQAVQQAEGRGGPTCIACQPGLNIVNLQDTTSAHTPAHMYVEDTLLDATHVSKLSAQTAEYNMLHRLGGCLCLLLRLGCQGLLA